MKRVGEGGEEEEGRGLWSFFRGDGDILAAPLDNCCPWPSL